jgi:hypothetical protein
MTRPWPFVVLSLIAIGSLAQGTEERIRGVLEKTANPNASAQITDALNDVYYVVKTIESEKACNSLIGQRVVLTGTVEERADDRLLYLTLKQAEVYQPKQPEKPADTPISTPLPPPTATPPAPTPAPVPPAGETKKTEP